MSKTRTRKTNRKRPTTTRSQRRSPKRGGVKALRHVLATAESEPVQPRADLSRSAEVVVGSQEAAGLTFVAAVSTNGPWELRSLVINDFQVLHTTVPSTTRRIDVPIPQVLGSTLKVTWSIIAGHLILDAGTFIEPQGQQAVLLASKGPIKKGESWAPLLPTRFPRT